MAGKFYLIAAQIPINSVWSLGPWGSDLEALSEISRGQGRGGAVSGASSPADEQRPDGRGALWGTVPHSEAREGPASPSKGRDAEAGRTSSETQSPESEPAEQSAGHTSLTASHLRQGQTSTLGRLIASPWERMYTRGGFMSMYGKTNTVL